MQLLKNKAVVTGGYGLLGYHLLRLMREKFAVYGIVRTLHPDVALEGVEYVECDIANRKKVVETLKSIHPKIIINTAAYTNVDRSESDRETCWKINVDGVSNLAHAAKLIGTRLVHVSTDYVFDGRGGPYRESDRPNPLGFYGKSKLGGENALRASGADYAIARTMVLYGRAPAARPNFVTWVIEQLTQGRQIRIVHDQIGQPTLASELAEALVALAASGKDGIFHISGSEAVDRNAFAHAIADEFGLDSGLILKIKTAELHQPAPRPMNSVFDLSKLENELHLKLSGVREGLKKFRKSPGEKN